MKKQEVTDTSLDHRSLDWAIEIIGMCEPIRCVQGGMWFGNNNNFADATFVDYGAADAFAVAAKTLPALVRALQDIEGGHFSGDLSWGSSSLAVEGNWKRMYESLQQIARNALVGGPSHD